MGVPRDAHVPAVNLCRKIIYGMPGSQHLPFVRTLDTRRVEASASRVLAS